MRILTSVAICWFFISSFAQAQGAYWKAINDNGYYSDPFQACYESHQSYSANTGNGHDIKPDGFGLSYDKYGGLTQVYCKWEKNGEPGYWGTAGTSVLKCPGNEVPQDNGGYCGHQPKTGETNCMESPDAGNPINIHSGSKRVEETDFVVGRGRLYFARTYSSNRFTSPTKLGRNWASNFHPAVKGSHHWYYGHFAWVDSTGKEIRFMRDNSQSGGAWRQPGIPWYPSNWFSRQNKHRDDQLGYTLTEETTTKLVLKDPAGVERDFEYTAVGEADPILTKIRYPDGYEITLNYGPDRVVTSVDDTDGYSISFTYSDRNLLDTVTAPDGSVYRYEYKDLPDSTWVLAAMDPNYPQLNVWDYYSVMSSVIYPDDTPGSDTDNPRKTYNYDHATNHVALTSLEDERGIIVRTWDYAWGTTGWRALSSVGPNGNEQTTITETVDREQFSVTNALGKETIYHFDKVGFIPKITEVDGVALGSCAASNTDLNYDSEGNLTSVTSPEGQLTTRTIDQSTGLASSVTFGSGSAAAVTTNLTWDTTLRQPLTADRPGVTAAYAYDADWNLTSLTLTDTTSHSSPYSTSGQTRVWTYGWGADGLLQSVNGPLAGSGDTISFTYDLNGNVASVTDEVGLTATINAVDGMGRPTQITDPNGKVTTMGYTPRGWVDWMTETAGGTSRTTDFAYDLAGNLTLLTTPDGSSYTYTYNDSGWLTLVSTNVGDQIGYQHDLLGNITRTDFKTGGGGSLAHMAMQYDELGRITQRLGGAGDLQNYGYDRSDRQTSRTDGLGRNWLTGFDALNRVVSQTDPESHAVSYGWSSTGDLGSFSDARSLTTSYVRNGFGETIREVSPDRGITDYWRDDAGRITRILDAAGNDVSYAYDDAGRLLSESYPTQPALDVTYTYDQTSGGNKGQGRLTTVSNVSSGHIFSYNGFGGLTSHTQTVGTGIYPISYEIAANGQLNGMTLPSGREVDYAYDGLNRVTSISTRASSSASTDSIVSGVAYASFGPITGYTLGNGATASFGLDASYRLSTLGVSDGSTSLLGKTYGYDANSRITNIFDTLDTAATTAYTYHDDGRLESADGPWGEYEWTYDPVGNRLTEDLYASGSLVSGYDYAYESTSNRLTSISDSTPVVTRTLSYTANGSIDLDSRGGGFDYDYDQDGRLSEVKVGGSTDATYTYDAFEHRVRRSVTGGSLSHFVFSSAGQLLGEYDGASGTVITEYIWLEGRLVATVDGAGVISYVQTGHLGQPLLVMDGSAGVLWRGETSPFGAYVYTSGASGDPNLRFPGQWLEAGSGLYHNWHRDYDPTLGRYIEADPLGIAAGQSVFSYVGQDPLNLIDPEGLNPLLAGRGAFAFGQAVGRGINWYRNYRAAKAAAAAAIAADVLIDIYNDDDIGICKPLITVPLVRQPISLPLDDTTSSPDDDDDRCFTRYDGEMTRCNTVRGSSKDAVRWRQGCKQRAAERLAWCLKDSPDLQPEWPGSY